MNDSTKLKFLYSAVAILVALNIGVIGFILMNHLHGPWRGHPAETVVKELGFTPEQQQLFEKIREEHRQEMRDINHNGRVLHDAMFAQLSDGLDKSAAADSIITAIAENAKMDETTTYHHLVKLRKICTPAQQKIFDEMIARAMANGHKEKDSPSRD